MNKKKEVLRKIIELNSKIRRVVFSTDITSKYSMGTRQMQTLFNLIGQEPMTMSAAAQSIKVSNQQMTKIINTLVEKSYVERIYDPTNRRIVLIKITQAGIDNVEGLYSDIVGHLNNKGVNISDKRLDEFLVHINHVEEFLKEVNSIV